MSPTSDDLDKNEARRVGAEVEHFIDLLEKRYDVRLMDVIDSIKWMKERKALNQRILNTFLLSIIGVVVGAVIIALWEGVKIGVAR